MCYRDIDILFIVRVFFSSKSACYTRIGAPNDGWLSHWTEELWSTKGQKSFPWPVINPESSGFLLWQQMDRLCFADSAEHVAGGWGGMKRNECLQRSVNELCKCWRAARWARHAHTQTHSREHEAGVISTPYRLSAVITGVEVHWDYISTSFKSTVFYIMLILLSKNTLNILNHMIIKL